MPANQNESQPYQYQEHLGAFGQTDSPNHTAEQTFSSPPIPANQDSIELHTPLETLEVLRDKTSDIRTWLSYIKHHYTPPDQTDVLLLYPCASQKPMAESNSYQALSRTLSAFSHDDQRRIHVVTVSEPMGLIPFELQDGETWLYDTPGLFRWWCQENGTEWNEQAQQQCLRILGEHIAGFLDRAAENDWYDAHLTCVRHMTVNGNTSIDQTHRQMLETAEAITGVELTWLPTEETLTALTGTDEHAWQMQGVAYEPVQTELAAYLTDALDRTQS